MKRFLIFFAAVGLAFRCFAEDNKTSKPVVIEKVQGRIPSSFEDTRSLYVQAIGEISRV